MHLFEILLYCISTKNFKFFLFINQCWLKDYTFYGKLDRIHIFKMKVMISLFENDFGSCPKFPLYSKNKNLHDIHAYDRNKNIIFQRMYKFIKQFYFFFNKKSNFMSKQRAIVSHRHFENKLKKQWDNLTCEIYVLIMPMDSH